MSIPDDALAAVVGARRRRRRAPGRADGVEARSSRGASRGRWHPRRRGGGGGGALHARRARGRRSGRGSGAPAARRTTPCTCRPSSPAAFGLSTSEARRMIAQGGREARRRDRLGARRSPLGGRREGAPGGQAALRETRGSRSLTGLRGAATLLRPPEREARKALRHWSAFARFGYDLFVARRFGGLWRERRPFRCPPSPASVLENSTACVCDEKRRRVEPIRSAGWRRLTSLPVNLASTSRWLRGLTPFERRSLRLFVRPSAGTQERHNELEGRQQFAWFARQPVSSRRV